MILLLVARLQHTSLHGYTQLSLTFFNGCGLIWICLSTTSYKKTHRPSHTVASPISSSQSLPNFVLCQFLFAVHFGRFFKASVAALFVHPSPAGMTLPPLFGLQCGCSASSSHGRYLSWTLACQSAWPSFPGNCHVLSSSLISSDKRGETERPRYMVWFLITTEIGKNWVGKKHDIIVSSIKEFILDELHK
jgi:hypothetical protein